MFQNLRADLRRARQLNVPDGWFNQHIRVWFELGTIAVIDYRFRHWANTIRIPVIRQVLKVIGMISGYAVQIIIGVNIGTDAEIGPGFTVHTPYGVLIDGSLKIGCNCVVQNGVHLAGTSGRIGDNVYLGPGVKVIGWANIGNNVVVVANSLVMSDVPDNMTVLGVPARIRFPRGAQGGGRGVPRPVNYNLSIPPAG